MNASLTASSLLPCPCGAPCDTDEGPYPINHAVDLFRLNCQDSECGRSVIAPSASQCLVDWNRRAPFTPAA